MNTQNNRQRQSHQAACDHGYSTLEMKSTFISSEIAMQDWDSDDFDRYDYPREELNPEDYGAYTERYPEWETLPKEHFDEWAEENLSYEELYCAPMMNALRYFPSFVSFDLDEDNKKCSGATCLIYDNQLDRYAVAMSGGGMDLSPHLLDTFIELGKGVPLELAVVISKNYSAYISKEKHTVNCMILSEALNNKADSLICLSKDLV